MSLILIIEDNDIVLDLLIDEFVRWGISAIGVTDPEAGLEYARLNNFDFVLCDVHMPISGHEVTRRIKEMSPRSSVALMSGDITQLDRSKSLGPDIFISKVGDLRQQLKKWVKCGYERKHLH